MENQPLSNEDQGEQLFQHGKKRYKRGEGESRGLAKKSIREAIEDFEKAIALGNSNAMVKMADIHFYGLPNSINGNLAGDYMIDKDKAIKLYKKAADLNNSKAHVRLGEFSWYGKLVEQNYDTAIKYYEKADLLNNAKAAYTLGNIYKDGVVVKQDMCRAFKYFEKADLLGNVDASFYLGEKYRNGFDVEQDYFRAFKYYENAIKLKKKKIKNSYALIRLGWLYDRGLGVKQDYNKAYPFFQKANTLGNKHAENSIGCIEYRKNYIEKAVNSFTYAYRNSKDLDAVHNLNVLNYNRYYPVKIDPPKPEYYTRKLQDFEPYPEHPHDIEIRQNYEYEQSYNNAKNHFYAAAYEGNSDAIADSKILLYVIDRVKDDNSKYPTKLRAQLLKNLLAQYDHHIQAQLYDKVQDKLRTQTDIIVKLEEQSQKKLTSLNKDKEDYKKYIEDYEKTIIKCSQAEEQFKALALLLAQFKESFQAQEKPLEQLLEQLQKQEETIEKLQKQFQEIPNTYRSNILSQEHLQELAALLAVLLDKPKEELVEKLQGQHGGYKQKYLKYKKKYIQLKN
jgi:TPR repeat protein